jgi:hypothetical protein
MKNSGQYKKGSVPTNYSHGQTRGGKRTKLYTCWRNMMNRCYQPSTSRFKNYGGRGIRVDERWHDFENFRKDMGDPPRSTSSIERRNTDLNYCPENCCWIELREQTKNQTRSRKITAFGRTQIASDWSKEFGVSVSRILRRIKSGWHPERAVSVIPTQENSLRGVKPHRSEQPCNSEGA